MPVVARAPMLTVLRPTPKPRVGFIAAFDQLGQGVGVFSLSGMLIHETSVLRRARSDENFSRLIRGAVSSMAIRVAAARREAAAPDPVRIHEGSHIVHATLYQPSDEPMVLIHAEVAAALHQPMTDEGIIARYHLTPAELRVARLLAVGMSNKHIARELGVSEHTTRHQTERVLRKLGITSRSAVASRLMGAD